MNNPTYLDSASDNLEQKLQAIRDKEPNTIRAYVADEALDYGGDSPADLFRDLSVNGCVSGVIGRRD